MLSSTEYVQHEEKEADMMVTICILTGLSLAACGFIIARATNKGRNGTSKRVPSPLPRRVNMGTCLKTKPAISKGGRK